MIYTAASAIGANFSNVCVSVCTRQALRGGTTGPSASPRLYIDKDRL